MMWICKNFARDCQPSEILDRDCFGPFREVVTSYEDIFVSFDHCYLKGAYDFIPQARNGEECVVRCKGSGVGI